MKKVFVLVAGLLLAMASAFADGEDGYDDFKAVFSGRASSVWFNTQSREGMKYKDTSDKTLAQIRRDKGETVYVMNIYDILRNFPSLDIEVLGSGFLCVDYEDEGFKVHAAELPYSVVAEGGSVILRYSVTVVNFEWLRNSYRVTVAVIVDEAYYRENMKLIGGIR